MHPPLRLHHRADLAQELHELRLLRPGKRLEQRHDAARRAAREQALAVGALPRDPARERALLAHAEVVGLVGAASARVPQLKRRAVACFGGAARMQVA